MSQVLLTFATSACGFGEHTFTTAAGSEIGGDAKHRVGAWLELSGSSLLGLLDASVRSFHEISASSDRVQCRRIYCYHIECRPMLIWHIASGN